MSVTTLPIIENTYQVYKHIVALNTKVPKIHRYTLCAETEKSILALLELPYMAGAAPKAQKSAYLLRAQARLEIIRLHLRLYLEFGLGSETWLFQLQSALEETGRMLGGWLKSSY